MVILRADATPRDGLSRLRRCAYLASLLRKGNDVLLCCREDKGAAKFLAGKKVSFRLVRDPATIDISGAKAIIFDLASFSNQDGALLQRAKEAGLKTVCILPVAEESQAVDFVFPPVAAPLDALLHHKFRHFHKARRKYRRRPRLVFVNLGDLLPYRGLRQVVDTLHRLRLLAKIAPGPGVKKADKRNLMRIYPGVHFCGKSESRARAYFEADLALVPPGEEAWEAAAVGTPALYMPLDNGHDALAAACSELGIGVGVPALADWSVQALQAVLEPLTPELRERMGAAGKALVDGLGVQRFFRVLKENGIL